MPLSRSPRLLRYIVTSGLRFTQAGPDPGMRTSDTTPGVTGRVPPGWTGLSLTVDPDGVSGGPYGPFAGTNNLDGTWSVADNVLPTLAAGSYPLIISATDDKGKSQSKRGVLIIEPEAGFTIGFSLGFNS